MAALRHNKMVAPMVVEGAMTGEMFLAYVENCLVPMLRRNDVVASTRRPWWRGEQFASLLRFALVAPETPEPHCREVPCPVTISDNTNSTAATNGQSLHTHRRWFAAKISLGALVLGLGRRTAPRPRRHPRTECSGPRPRRVSIQQSPKIYGGKECQLLQTLAVGWAIEIYRNLSQSGSLLYRLMAEAPKVPATVQCQR